MPEFHNSIITAIILFAELNVGYQYDIAKPCAF